MKTKYAYYYFQSKLTPEVCQSIIKTGNNKIEEDKKNGVNTNGVTFGDSHKLDNSDRILSQSDLTVQQLKNQKIDTNKTYVRDSEVSWLTDQWIYDIVMPIVDEANFLSGWRYQYDTCEPFQFTKYNKGGFYGWHNDFGTDHFAKRKRYIEGITNVEKRKQGNLPGDYTQIHELVGKVRKLSVTINLNVPGDYDGGNLMFDYGEHFEENKHECVEIRPQGSVIVFPSYMHHCVTPVTRGVRYSLVLWVNGEPFK